MSLAFRFFYIFRRRSTAAAEALNAPLRVLRHEGGEVVSTERIFSCHRIGKPRVRLYGNRNGGILQKLADSLKQVVGAGRTVYAYYIRTERRKSYRRLSDAASGERPAVFFKRNAAKYGQRSFFLRREKRRFHLIQIGHSLDSDKIRTSPLA